MLERQGIFLFFFASKENNSKTGSPEHGPEAADVPSRLIEMGQRCEWSPRWESEMLSQLKERKNRSVQDSKATVEMRANQAEEGNNKLSPLTKIRPILEVETVNVGVLA